MNKNVIVLAFSLILLVLSGCNSEKESASEVSVKSPVDSKQSPALEIPHAEAFKSENRLTTNKSIIQAQLAAYTKSYLDIADVYVLKLKVGEKEIKLTSLMNIDISSKVNSSRTLFTFTKPKNYLIFYSYNATTNQSNEMRIPTDSLKAGQFTDFPVLDEKTGKLILTRIELLKIQYKK